MFNFENKVVLITGATSCIGHDTALAFAKAGAAVALVGRREKEGAAAVKTIESTGGKAVFFQADLAASEKVIVDHCGLVHRDLDLPVALYTNSC